MITGATRGIGRAIAIALGKQGAVVIGTATSDSGADSISDYLAKAAIQGTGMTLDVTDGPSIGPLIDRVVEAHGAPTVLVNNAGITRDNLVLRMKEEEWDTIIETNLKSIFRLAKACLRGMTRARHGRIVNISSVVGATGNPGQANYAAAKAGIMGFTKSLAREVGARNITVNTVAPGLIATDMTQGLSQEQTEALTAAIPVGRLGTPEEVAHAVVFLASPLAGYITGTTLHVNGGMYMG